MPIDSEFNPFRCCDYVSKILKRHCENWAIDHIHVKNGLPIYFCKKHHKKLVKRLRLND